MSETPGVDQRLRDELVAQGLVGGISQIDYCVICDVPAVHDSGHAEVWCPNYAAAA
jgi:hypothetical protein